MKTNTVWSTDHPTKFLVIATKDDGTEMTISGTATFEEALRQAKTFWDHNWGFVSVRVDEILEESEDE